MLIGAVIMLVLAIAVFAVLSVTVLFPVKTVTAEKTAHYTASEIISASALSDKNNILTLSTAKTAERIKKALPYAGEVTVSRSLPDTVNIKIKSEVKEFACIPSDGVYYAVSDEWRVLNKYDLRPEQLFTVSGGGTACKIGEQVSFSDEKTGNAIKKAAAALKANGIEINAVVAERDGTLTAAVCGRFSVKFGTAAELDRKAAHLAGMLRSIEPDKTGKIDLSMWSATESEGAFIAGAVDLTPLIDPQNAEK